jgi:S-adenosylmethionine synthetase
MVDRFVPTDASYFEQKDAIRDDVERYVRERLQGLEEVTVDLNTLDDSARGQDGMYLTVIGTSAESGDGGEVGRGNGVNGLISLNRPTSNEAAAGKNTVCHVGNIYNHLSHRIASEIVESIVPVRESYVWLCSQIGQPIDKPWSTSVRVSLEPGVDVDDVEDEVNAIVSQQLKNAATLRTVQV